MPRPVLGARKVAINTTIDPRLLAEVDARARQLERTRSEIIREALRMWLEYEEQEAEIDRNLARIAEERMADPNDRVISHEEAMKRLGLSP